MENNLKDLCQTLEAYEFDGSDDILDRKELLEDVQETLDDIKQLIANSTDDRYVQANILFQSDDQDSIPKDILVSAAMEVLGSGSYVEIKDSLIQEIDKLSDTVENIIFDDTEEATFADRFLDLKDSISGLTDDLLHNESVLSGSETWDKVSAFNENAIADKLEGIPDNIKEQIVDSYAAETDSGKHFFFEKNEKGEIEVTGPGIQYDNVAHSNAFGMNGFGEFVSRPEEGLTPKDFERYLYNLNILNGGVGENAAIGEINPYYLNQEERSCLINAFVIKGLGDEDTRKYVELSPNDLSALEHFSKCEAHALGYEILEKDQLADRIDQAFEKINIESPISSDSDHTDAPSDIGGFHAAEGRVETHGSLMDKDTYGKNDRAVGDSIKTATAEEGGYSVLWKLTGNEKIDEHIKIRNEYITRTGPYPHYRKSLRFNFHEMRAVTMAFKEKEVINGRIPDIRDLLTAYNNFRSCNVFELGVETLLLGVFRLFENKPEDKIENKPEDMEKQPKDTELPIENISEEKPDDLETGASEKAVDIPEGTDPVEKIDTEAETPEDTEKDLDGEEVSSEDTEEDPDVKPDLDVTDDNADVVDVPEEENPDGVEPETDSADEPEDTELPDMDKDEEANDLENTSDNEESPDIQDNDEEDKAYGEAIDSDDTAYSDNESVGANIFADAFARMKDNDNGKVDAAVSNDTPERSEQKTDREPPQEVSKEISEDRDPDTKENIQDDQSEGKMDEDIDGNEPADKDDNNKVDDDKKEYDKERDPESKDDTASDIAGTFTDVAEDDKADTGDFLDHKIEVDGDTASIRDVLADGTDDLKEKIADAIASEIGADIQDEEVIENYADLIAAITDVTGDPEFLSLVEDKADDEKQEVLDQIAEKIAEIDVDKLADEDITDNLVLDLSVLENDIMNDVAEIMDTGMDFGIDQGFDEGMETNMDTNYTESDSEMPINTEIDPIMEPDLQPDIEEGIQQSDFENEGYNQMNPEFVMPEMDENQKGMNLFENNNYTSDDLLESKTMDQNTANGGFYSDSFVDSKF